MLGATKGPLDLVFGMYVGIKETLNLVFEKQKQLSLVASQPIDLVFGMHDRLVLRSRQGSSFKEA